MEQSVLESTNLNLYRTLQSISAVLFHDIKHTGNIFLLDKDYDEKKEYEIDEITDIHDAWYALYDEYFEVSNNISLKKTLKNKDSNLKLLVTIKTIEDILNILIDIHKNSKYIPKESYLKTISSIGNDLKRLHKNIDFDTIKPLPELINKVDAVLGGLKTKYELKFKEDSIEENGKNTFYDIKSIIEVVLKKDYIPDYINMLQWIAYENQYRRRLKEINRINNGGK